MSNFITKTKVIDRAFTRKIHENKLHDGVIQTAQYKYIRPVLGEDLYDALVDDPTASKFADLLELVREALAWWVKYISLPEIFIEIADTGVKIIETQNTTQVTDQRFIELRESTRIICEDKTSQITDYLENEDTDLDDYLSGDNVDHKISMAGGIITRVKTTCDPDEDCPEKWK